MSSDAFNNWQISLFNENIIDLVELNEFDFLQDLPDFDDSLIIDSNYSDTSSKVNEICNDNQLYEKINIVLNSSEEKMQKWLRFPQKLVKCVNSGDISKVITLISNLFDPKCVCRLNIWGKSIVKQGSIVVEQLYDAVM